MRQYLGIFMILFALVALSTSCNNEDDISPEGTEQGEGNGEGHGEGGEGNGEGGEGNGEGGNESGTLWDASATADEIVNGLHLILSYDASTECFVGTLENLNTTTAPQTRVEVHIFDAAGNSTEYGPTPAVDMAPGEIRNVQLCITGAAPFVQFNMHPEVGSGGEGGESGEGSGEGGEGSEGGGEGSGEGGEGNGNGETGNESGTLWDRTATADETVNGIRLTLSFDEASQSFVGTLENINTVAVPQVRVETHVFDAVGNSIEYGPTTPADMAPGEIRMVTLPAPNAGAFVQFNMHPEVG